MSKPYRGLSVQEVDIPLSAESIESFLIGREVYRRTDFIVLKNLGLAALVQVCREPGDGLFVHVASCSLLAGPHELAWIESATTDVGNATALAAVAQAHSRAGIIAYVVHGKYEHVNFILHPSPLQIRVTEVVPPLPPKLFAMAEEAVAFDEDLPPVDLCLDAVDITETVALNPARLHLLPCRGSQTKVAGSVEYLDTRPAQRQDWLLVGCERSAQFHRHFYGDEPPSIDICPARRKFDSAVPTLTKCCLLERGIEVGDGRAVVPWGANLDEVRSALRYLAGLPQPPVPVMRGNMEGNNERPPR